MAPSVNRQTVVGVCAVLMLYGFYKSGSMAGTESGVGGSVTPSTGYAGIPAVAAPTLRPRAPSPPRIVDEVATVEHAIQGTNVPRPPATEVASAPNSKPDTGNYDAPPPPTAATSQTVAPSSSGALRPAFEAWQRRAGCVPALATTRRDERFLEPVWAGAAEDPNAPINDVNSPQGESQARAFIAKNSAFSTAPPTGLTQDSPRPLLVVWGPGAVPSVAKDLSKLFHRAFVVGGPARKMQVQACNDESWLRVMTCVAHLIQTTNIGQNYTSVTLLNIASGNESPTAADHDRWLCTVKTVLDQQYEGNGVFSFSVQPTGSPVGDRCKVGSLIEDAAYWLSKDDYERQWDAASSAVLGAMPPTSKDFDALKANASLFVERVYAQRHMLRFLHLPLAMLPLFTFLATPWRLLDVVLEDGVAPFLDLLAINARRQGIPIAAAAAFDGPAAAKSHLVWTGESKCAGLRDRMQGQPEKIDDLKPRHDKTFVPPAYHRVQWYYPLVATGPVTPAPVPDAPDTLLPGVPKLWRQARRQRTPAVFIMLKNTKFAERPAVKRYLKALTRHFRRVLVETLSPMQINQFAPHVSAFCGCGNDYIGCVHAFFRTRFFQRSGGFIFAHGDAYFVPQEWMGENNFRHLVVSKEHPFTEGIDAKNDRWKRATQGPSWVWDDHSLSAVRGRRPNTLFIHLMQQQQEMGSVFGPYMEKRPGFKKNVEDSVANVVFGDLSYYPAAAMEVVAIALHHMFPHMVLAEPATGWMASVSSLVTGTPRDSFKYTGGCCFGNEVPKIRRSPAGHKFDLNKANIVDAVTSRIEESFSCKTSPKIREVAPRKEFESFSSSTCALEYTLECKGPETTFEVVNAFTNDVTITIVPDGTSPVSVTVVLMTTNANSIVVRGRKGAQAPITLRVILATGVWRATPVLSRVTLSSGGRPGGNKKPESLDTVDGGSGKDDAPAHRADFDLDEDADTLVLGYEGLLDAVSVDVDTAAVTTSTVTIDGGENVSAKGVAVSRAAKRLED